MGVRIGTLSNTVVIDVIVEDVTESAERLPLRSIMAQIDDTMRSRASWTRGEGRAAGDTAAVRGDENPIAGPRRRGRPHRLADIVTLMTSGLVPCSCRRR
jgi:hypothetical protein